MRIRAIWLFFLLGASAWASAQDAPKVGYVDVKAVLDQSPQVIARRQELNREFSARNDAISDDEKRLLAMEQQLAQDAGLDEQGRAQLERDYRVLQRSVNRRREDLQEEINFRLNDMIQDIDDTMDFIIRSIGEAEGYDVILASGPTVLYYTKSVDITPLVLQRLEEEYQADQQELATELSQ